MAQGIPKQPFGGLGASALMGSLWVVGGGAGRILRLAGGLVGWFDHDERL